MLTRWDPFREMVSFREAMDQHFDRFFEEQPKSWQSMSWRMPLDVSEDDNEFIVKAALPGVNPDDLEITFTSNTLTIKGEVKAEQEIEKERYHLRERRYGKFERSIVIPSKVKEDAIEAHYENGELILRLPKTEEMKPKRIAVKSGSSQKVLEGSFKGNAKKN